MPRPEAASRSAIEVLESVEPGPELARAYAAQAYVRMLNRDNADGVMWGKRSAALAERLGDVDTLAYALTMIGTSYLMAGEIEMGVEYLERSLTIGREHGLWLWVGPTLSMLGSGLGEMYELELSERYLHEHIAHTDEHDLWPHYSRAWLSLVEAYTGRWDEADHDRTGRALEGERLDQPHQRADRDRPRARASRRPGGRRGPRRGTGALPFRAATCSGSGTCERHVPRRRGWSVTASSRPRRHAPRTRSRSRSATCGSPASSRTGSGRPARSTPGPSGSPSRGGFSSRARRRQPRPRGAARGCPYEAARALADAEAEPPLRDALASLERLGAAPAARVVRQRLRDARSLASPAVAATLDPGEPGRADGT